ncbi:hypothetical protein, partial [Pseudomonas sp. 2822-15]|uniref:hypothetical protein n=1 Tax=Pseudomonas sp. 2822-15 TaxID=1712677 RepID=UPI001304692F
VNTVRYNDRYTNGSFEFDTDETGDVKEVWVEPGTGEEGEGEADGGTSPSSDHPIDSDKANAEETDDDGQATLF